MKILYTLIIFSLSLSALAGEPLFKENQPNKKGPLFDLSLESDFFSVYGFDLGIRYDLNKYLAAGALSGLEVERYNVNNEYKGFLNYDKVAYNVPTNLYVRFGYSKLSLQAQIGYHFSTRKIINGLSVGGRFYYKNLYLENTVVFTNETKILWSMGLQFYNLFNR